MAERPIDLHIGHIEDALECASSERQVKRAPHQTLRAVTTDQILSCQSLCVARRVLELRCDARASMRKTVQFGFPKHVFAMTTQVIVKKSLVFALLQHEHVRIRA